MNRSVSLADAIGLQMLILASLGRVAAGQPGEAPQPGCALSVAAVLRDEQALNEAHDVELEGKFAYVAGKGGSIAIVDVNVPSRPKLVWFHLDPDLLSDAETVLTAPGRLFLGSDDFHSLDVSNPVDPQFDRTLRDRTKIHTINGLVRRGDYLFAASKRGLVTAIEVSDPRNPKVVGVIEARARYQVSDPHDIDLFKLDLIVVDPAKFGARPGQLSLFRIFDDDGRLMPESRWRLTSLLTSDQLTGANRVQVRGHYAFIGGSYSPRFSDGRPNAKGIVVDLSDSEQPRISTTVDFPDLRGPNGLTIAGDVWFLAGGQTVQAYDIREPTRPRLLASLRSPEAFPTADDNAHDLVYRDGHLFVTSQGDHGLVTLKVNDESIRQLAATRPEK
jgi:hypothetical protein